MTETLAFCRFATTARLSSPVSAMLLERDWRNSSRKRTSISAPVGSGRFIAVASAIIVGSAPNAAAVKSRVFVPATAAPMAVFAAASIWKPSLVSLLASSSASRRSRFCR
jgi:hypothetical protein